MVDCDYFEVIDWDEETEEVIHAVCSRPSPYWPNCNKCLDRVKVDDEIDTKDTLIDELVEVKDIITAAVKWWDEEAKYLTQGDYGGHNVFDDDPEWVVLARKTLDDAPPPTSSKPSNTVLLKTQLTTLTQGDVEILDGSINRQVRVDNDEDNEIHRLYHIYKSL